MDKLMTNVLITTLPSICQGFKQYKMNHSIIMLIKKKKTVTLKCSNIYLYPQRIYHIYISEPCKLTDNRSVLLQLMYFILVTSFFSVRLTGRLSWIYLNLIQWYSTGMMCKIHEL